MKPRSVQVSPQARRDVEGITSYYRNEVGAAAAAKVARTIRAGVRAVAVVSLIAATRPDFPQGYYRVVAKAHLIVFKMEGDVARVVRVIHGARDPQEALGETE